MSQENDVPENDEILPVERHQLDANEAARRRVMEFESSLAECRHADAEREAAATVESAKIIEKWESSDPHVRERLLDRVGREMMTVHEAPPPELQAKDMAPQELGRYADEDFRIEINQDLLSQNDVKDALDTYLHEYRHAEQAYEVTKSHGAMSHSVNTQRAVELEFNQKRYLDPDDGQSEYERQLLEVDARKFADDATNNILERRDDLRATGRGPMGPVDADEVAALRAGVDQPAE